MLRTFAFLPTAQTRLIDSGLPIQPNWRGSNLMLGRSSSACDGRLREKLPMTVPSLAAALKTWLAATTVPAPGMFCTMIDGRPGMCRPMCRASIRLQRS